MLSISEQTIAPQQRLFALAQEIARVAAFCFCVAAVGCSYQRFEMNTEERGAHGSLLHSASTQISSGTFLNGKVSVQGLNSTNSPEVQSISVDRLELQSETPL